MKSQFYSKVTRITTFHTAVEDMRWLRLVGFPKTYVSNAKEPYTTGYIRPKETYF